MDPYSISGINLQEPIMSVKMSMDSGLNSSVASTAGSGRMTPAASSLKYNEACINIVIFLCSEPIS